MIMEENVTLGTNYYTGLCLLKIKNSFILPSQEPSLLEGKTPDQTFWDSEAPELNTSSGQAETQSFPVSDFPLTIPGHDTEDTQ